MLRCVGQKVTRWTKAPDVAHFIPLSFSTHHSPAGHHNISKWASARVSTPLRFAQFLVLSLIYESNRTPPFHASSVGCTFCVSMFFFGSASTLTHASTWSSYSRLQIYCWPKNTCPQTHSRSTTHGSGRLRKGGRQIHVVPQSVASGSQRGRETPVKPSPTNP